MLENSLHSGKIIYCYLHKKQKATHLCIDLRCMSNPILCQQCFHDNNPRILHDMHESSIVSIQQGVQRLANSIRNQSKSVQKVYNQTIGMKQYQPILKILEKGDTIYEQMQNRVKTLKTQVQLQLDLLTKDFQKRILLQKQQFFKSLQNYQRIFSQNIQYTKSQTQHIIQFEQGLKYYGNTNNLFLKLVQQSKKKSIDWLLNKKKILNNLTKLSDSSYAISDMSKNLHNISSMGIDRLPIWMGDQMQLQDQKNKQLMMFIRKNLDGWVKIPDTKIIQKNQQKTISYYSYNR